MKKAAVTCPTPASVQSDDHKTLGASGVCRMDRSRSTTVPVRIRNTSPFIHLQSEVLIGCYRQFAKEISTIAMPFQFLLQKKAEWGWTTKCEDTIHVKRSPLQLWVLHSHSSSLPFINTTPIGLIWSTCPINTIYTGQFASKVYNFPPRAACILDISATSRLDGAALFILGHHTYLQNSCLPSPSVSNGNNV